MELASLVPEKFPCVPSQTPQSANVARAYTQLAKVAEICLSRNIIKISLAYISPSISRYF